MWRFLAARATGASHLKAELPCQDYFACEILAPDVIVAALADGAGSAANGGRGAEIAVETVVSRVSHAFEAGGRDFPSLLRDAALVAREAVLAEATQQGSEPRTHASTLLALVLTREGGAALHIGDGVIIVNGDDDWRWLFWPQHGEYVNTTYFLTDEAAAERMQVAAVPGQVTGFALTSDGLEPLVLHYATRAVHHPFFNSMFKPLIEAAEPAAIPPLSAALERFLASDRVASRTDDDVSLILATCKDSGSAP